MGKIPIHRCAGFFRDLCYRMRGLGRKRRRDREKGLERRRDQGQGVMVTSPQSGRNTSVSEGPGGNSGQNDGTATTSGEVPAQTGDSLAYSISSTPTSASSDGSPPENSPEAVPNTPNVPRTSALSISAHLTNTAWEPSQSVTIHPSELATPEGQEDLQPALSGNPSLNIQPNSTRGGDPTDAPPGLSETVSSANYSTLMSGEPGEAPSGGLLSPTTAFSLGNASKTTISTRHSTARAPHTTTSISTPSIAEASSSSDVRSLNRAPALPTMGHTNEVDSTRTVRTVAGATIAGVGIILLIVVSVFVYTRRGAMRSLGSAARFPSIRSRRKPHSSATFNESEENFFRRETTQIRPFDLERATVASGSHYSDDEDGWEEVDIRDARSGNMEKDNGEWLEKWRRGKERIVSTRPPPELRFNPQVPLPSISLEGQRRDY